MMTKKAGNIQSLSGEMLAEILRHAASNSVTDFVNASLSCKFFFEASKYDYIFENLSMEKHRLPWFKRDEVFLKRCKRAKNPEALYRKGMINFFHKRKPYSGLNYLKKAVEKGHVEAIYAYGIILICLGGKDEGLKVLSSLNLTSPSKRSLTIPGCRDKTEKMLTSMWIFVTLSKPEESVNDARVGCNCNDITMSQKLSRWSSEGQGWEASNNLPVNPHGCDSCFWDREATWLSNTVREYLVK